MLNKEEIEYIEELEKAIEDDKSFYWQEDMYELIEIIKKQNGREKKLIEKLEERRKLNNDIYGQAIDNCHIEDMYEYSGMVREDDYLLEIAKGEKL